MLRFVISDLGAYPADFATRNNGLAISEFVPSNPGFAQVKFEGSPIQYLIYLRDIVESQEAIVNDGPELEMPALPVPPGIQIRADWAFGEEPRWARAVVNANYDILREEF